MVNLILVWWIYLVSSNSSIQIPIVWLDISGINKLYLIVRLRFSFKYQTVIMPAQGLDFTHFESEFPIHRLYLIEKWLGPIHYGIAIPDFRTNQRVNHGQIQTLRFRKL